MQPFERAPYNKEVCDKLAEMHARAQQGKMNFFAWTACEAGFTNGGDHGFMGDITQFMNAHYNILHCAKILMDRIDALSGPTRQMEAPANLWLYDPTTEGISHDFIAWLVTIKLIQAREGVPGPTRIWFKQNDAEALMEDRQYRAGFVENVMKPALQLFDAVIDMQAIQGRRLNVYSYKELVAGAMKGEAIPRIQVPAEYMGRMSLYLQDIEPVVITLREHHNWEHRNSSLTDWLKFAEWLQDRGEAILFVRDTAHADEPITGFNTVPEASKDVLVRAALYEHAKCNMFVSNGPSSFALFGSRPWLMFVECEESETYACNTPRWWQIEHGIRKGEQFPWSTPQQRVVWAPDRHENMVTAWEETMSGVIQSVAA